MDSSQQQHTHLLLEDAHQTTKSYLQSDLRHAGRSSQFASCTRITCWDSSYVSPSGSSIASPWPSMASCPYSSGCRDKAENSSVVTEATIYPCGLTCYDKHSFFCLFIVNKFYVNPECVIVGAKKQPVVRNINLQSWLTKVFLCSAHKIHKDICNKEYADKE